MYVWTCGFDVDYLNPKENEVFFDILLLCLSVVPTVYRGLISRLVGCSTWVIIE